MATTSKIEGSWPICLLNHQNETARFETDSHMASAGCSQVWAYSQMPVLLRTTSKCARRQHIHGGAMKLVCASQTICSFDSSCPRRAPTCKAVQATHRHFVANPFSKRALQNSVASSWLEKSSSKEKSSFTADGLCRHRRATQQRGHARLLRGFIRAESSTAGGEAKQRGTKVQQLRQLLDGPGIVQGPACHDALR